MRQGRRGGWGELQLGTKAAKISKEASAENG